MGKRLLVEVHYKLNEGMRDEFLQKIKEAAIVEESRKEAGNGRYEYFFPVTDPDSLVLFEVWNTGEDQRRHTETEHYRRLSELKMKYVADTQVKKTIIEHTAQSHYIASCVFTSKYPELSEKIQSYVAGRFGIPVVRCCVPHYRFEYFNGQMPTEYRSKWSGLPDCGDYAPGDTVYSLCHNCSAIIEEYKKGVAVKSLWELILADETFAYPDYKGAVAEVQDCWRARGRRSEQDAVRALLQRMNFRVQELADNRDKTEFCGISLYRPSPKRNLELAPNRYVKNAEGKFLPHSREEQTEIMRRYSQCFHAPNVVDYCHYCQEGLEIGGVNAFHIASLLFDADECRKKIVRG